MMLMVQPKLTQSIVEQTPRSMISMMIVSSAFVCIFFKFIPLYILVVWFVSQGFLAAYRLYNVKMLKKYILQNNIKKIHKHEFFFLLSTIYQASMWTISSILALIYAPQPFELVTFVMVIGVITAAALSMSALYKAYLTFFFLMIIPQIMIMFYYGEHQHIGLAILGLIFIPSIMLLSKSIHSSRISSIMANDKLKKSVQELHKLSITDSLTNIFNRRYFFEVSDTLVSLGLREEKKVSLLMIDIDHFKEVNDIYGHQAGDFILIIFAKELDKITRKSDVFARVGGEEFSILLNDTSINIAKEIAEKIRTNIENKIFAYNSKKIKITTSIGIAELSDENNSIDKLYAQADKQLYKAKANGRNRVYPVE